MADEQFTNSGIATQGGDGDKNIPKELHTAGDEDDGNIGLPLTFETVESHAIKYGFSFAKTPAAYMQKYHKAGDGAIDINPPSPRTMVYGAMPRGNVHIVAIPLGRGSMNLACLPGGCPILFHTKAKEGIVVGQAYITTQGLSHHEARDRKLCAALIESKLRDKEQAERTSITRTGQHELDGTVTYFYMLPGGENAPVEAADFIPCYRTKDGGYIRVWHTGEGPQLERFKILKEADKIILIGGGIIEGVGEHNIKKDLTYVLIEEARLGYGNILYTGIYIAAETDNPRSRLFPEDLRKVAPTVTYNRFKHDPSCADIRKQYGNQYSLYTGERRTIVDQIQDSGERATVPLQTGILASPVSPHSSPEPEIPGRTRVDTAQAQRKDGMFGDIRRAVRGHPLTVLAITSLAFFIGGNSAASIREVSSVLVPAEPSPKIKAADTKTYLIPESIYDLVIKKRVSHASIEPGTIAEFATALGKELPKNTEPLFLISVFEPEKDRAFTPPLKVIPINNLFYYNSEIINILQNGNLKSASAEQLEALAKWHEAMTTAQQAQNTANQKLLEVFLPAPGKEDTGSNFQSRFQKESINKNAGLSR